MTGKPQKIIKGATAETSEDNVKAKSKAKVSKKKTVGDTQQKRAMRAIANVTTIEAPEIFDVFMILGELCAPVLTATNSEAFADAGKAVTHILLTLAFCGKICLRGSDVEELLGTPRHLGP